MLMLVEVEHRLSQVLLILGIAFGTGIALNAQTQPAGGLQEFITESYRAGQRRIVVPRGTYRISPPRQGSHLQFYGLTDLVIDAHGVYLVFTDQTRGGIEFHDCRNLRLEGATISYEVPPFTQGVVIGIGPGGNWYDIQIDTGYPSDLDNPVHFPAASVAYLFDRQTRLLKPATYDLSGKRTDRLGPGRFRVYWNRPSGPQIHPVSPGDLIAFRGTGWHNIAAIHCDHLSLNDVTITQAGAFAVWESEGEGGNHYSFKVKRGPPPEGATAVPLLSSTADAFHSTNVRHGPTLENCEFESMADDGIAIHGTFSFVFEAHGPVLLLNHSHFRPGDKLRLFDPAGSPVGDAVVKSVRPRESYANAKKSSRTTLSDPTQGPYTEVTLDRPLTAGFDDLASNPAASGSGYVIRNNTIRNHRARGMLLKADNGLVEGNTIEGSSMGGIVVTPEVWWNEASYSQNVRIVNNTIRGVAYAPQQLGGVVVAALEDRPIPGCGHRDIVLDGNRFENVNGVNLLITSACGVGVRNNRFIAAGRERVQAGGASWGENAQALIFVTDSKKVQFEGNTVGAMGPFLKKLVDVSPTAQVEGVSTGVRLSSGR
jgi:hypothetical protein